MSATDHPGFGTHAAGATGLPGQTRIRLKYETIVRAAFFLMISAGFLDFVEPAPYDFMFLMAAGLLFLSGFRLHRSLVLIYFLWIFYAIGGFIALAPYWHEELPKEFQIQSLYLVVTFFVLSIFFSERSEERLALGLYAFTIGSIVCALIGIAGYFNVAGLAKYTLMHEGRVASTFEDPNVLGSYLILAAMFLLQKLLLGNTRYIFIMAAGYIIIMLAIFLSFSRGSWGATALASMMIFATAFMTCGSARLRRRMLVLMIVALIGLAIALAGILSVESARTLLEQRFSVTQDYDVGATGRFGNQLRSLPMLLDLPNGFGPLRFRLTFGLEPHSSYINAFASYGWLGGFAWLLIVGSTVFVGFRLMFTPSPVRHLAQVWFVALFVLLLQGFQIDIDHWRWVFLCFGAVWGAEAGRVRWLQQQQRQPPAS